MKSTPFAMSFGLSHAQHRFYRSYVRVLRVKTRALQLVCNERTQLAVKHAPPIRLRACSVQLGTQGRELCGGITRSLLPPARSRACGPETTLCAPLLAYALKPLT